MQTLRKSGLAIVLLFSLLVSIEAYSIEWSGWSDQRAPDLMERSPLELDGLPDEGRIIIGIGFTEDRYRAGYEHVIHRHWIPKWTQHRPHLKFTILRFASIGLWQHHISQPDVVGAVWLSHTLTTRSQEEPTVFYPLAVDKKVIPSATFSAASPNLRFFLYLGCLGSKVKAYFNWESDLKKAGVSSFTFFYPSTKELHTFKRIIGRKNVDQVSEALNSLSSIVNNAPVQGALIKVEKQAELEIEIKDVYPLYDPKLIFLNGAWVGVLGGLENTSNSGEEWKTVSFPIYRQDLLSPNFKVQIEPIDWSEKKNVDQYQIRDVRLRVFDRGSESLSNESHVYHWKDRPDSQVISIGIRGAIPPQNPIEFTRADTEKLSKTVKMISGWKRHLLSEKKIAKKKQTVEDLRTKFLDSRYAQSWLCNDPNDWSSTRYIGKSFSCVLAPQSNEDGASLKKHSESGQESDSTHLIIRLP